MCAGPALGLSVTPTHHRARGLSITTVARYSANLLQACDGHLLLQALAAALLYQVIVHLSRAENEPLYLLRRMCCGAIFWNQPLEASS